MNLYDIIEKKRHGQSNTAAEVEYVIKGFTAGDIPDYMMSAYLMAVCINGADKDETFAMCKAMMESGDTLHFDSVVVDKHSTGGVSDSTSMILVPILASMGIDILKMSGRSLGFTGGTIDKIEVFSGYQADMSEKKLLEALHKNHGVIVSQSQDLCPADKKIYALRDKTATVDSIPLIASSIMSKKLATGAKIILLDVKYGSGAFMKSAENAVKLARTMVDIGRSYDRQVMAVVTDMDSPLGSSIGAKFEVADVLDVLDGKSSDLGNLAKFFACEIAGMYYKDQGKEIKRADIEATIDTIISSGAAKEKFFDIVKFGGGDISVVENLTKTKYSLEYKAKSAGYISRLDAYSLSKIVREMTDSAQDKASVGLRLNVNIGDKVNMGDTICTLHSNDKISSAIINALDSAVVISKKKTVKQLVYKVVR